MSRVHVTPEHVVQSAGRLGGISSQVADLHGQLGAHVSAGAGTLADGAVQTSFARWSTALPQYGQAADRLLVAMAAAAAGYQLTDDEVGGACDIAGGGTA
jgi:uncharacterized protein YukE